MYVSFTRDTAIQYMPNYRCLTANTCTSYAAFKWPCVNDAVKQVIAFDHILYAGRTMDDHLKVVGGRRLTLNTSCSQRGQYEMSAADLLLLCCGWPVAAAISIGVGYLYQSALSIVVSGIGRSAGIT